MAILEFAAGAMPDRQIPLGFPIWQIQYKKPNENSVRTLFLAGHADDFNLDQSIVTDIVSGLVNVGYTIISQVRLIFGYENVS